MLTTRPNHSRLFNAELRLLLERPSIDLSIREEGGQSALHCAAFAGQPRIIAMLLETGKVDTDGKDEDKQTALIHRPLRLRWTLLGKENLGRKNGLSVLL
jgi:ankyrin repeat protein